MMMDDTEPAEEADIDIAESPVPEPVPVSEPATVKRGMGFVPVFLMMLLAVGGGAVGGALIAEYRSGGSEDVSALATKSEVTEIKSDISGLERSLEDMSAELSNVSSDNSPSADTVDFSEITARIEALESRDVPAAESGAPSADLIARMEALEAKPDEVENTVLPDNLMARIEALEARTDEAKPVNAQEPVDLSPINDQLNSLAERLTALEEAAAAPAEPMINPEVAAELETLGTRLNTAEETLAQGPDLSVVNARMAEIEARISAVEQGPEIQTLPPFPREDVLNAVANSLGETRKGWFGRVLDSQVKVTPDELILKLDNIEKFLTDQNYDRALREIGELPEPGRKAAEGWVEILQEYRSQND